MQRGALLLMISFPFIVFGFGLFYLLKWFHRRNALTFAVWKQLLGFLFLCLAGLWAWFNILPHFQMEGAQIDWSGAKILLSAFAAVYFACYIIEWVNGSQWYQDAFRQGTGASMRWAGESVFRKMAMPLLWWKKGQIALGRSRFKFDSRSRRVGIKSSAHLLLLGLTGAGKSVYSLFHIIAKFRGSGLILDPSGEFAKVTAWMRRLRGYACFFLNPFQLGNLGSCSYNPLWEIDPYDPNAASLISAVVAGCVVQGSGGEAVYFAENTKLPLKGLLAHFLTTRPRDLQNLPAIADAIIDPDEFGELLKEMADNHSIGGFRTALSQEFHDLHRKFSEYELPDVRIHLFLVPLHHKKDLVDLLHAKLEGMQR